jgi:hypothetical protein
MITLILLLCVVPLLACMIYTILYPIKLVLKVLIDIFKLITK